MLVTRETFSGGDRRVGSEACELLREGGPRKSEGGAGRDDGVLVGDVFGDGEVMVAGRTLDSFKRKKLLGIECEV